MLLHLLHLADTFIHSSWQLRQDTTEQVWAESLVQGANSGSFAAVGFAHIQWGNQMPSLCRVIQCLTQADASSPVQRVLGRVPFLGFLGQVSAAG